ncbi:MAG TPA: ABC transporter ATP-binding protein [Phycisphaerales bacterium]|nr:ABC transporter ATP-binding protein [Phycisphaerales bacterium]
MVRHRDVGGGGPVVSAKGLTRTFRDFWMRTRAKAVDRIDFEIARGEIFGLLGPNGSGKSTTIKMILGLLRPTSGLLTVFGRPPSDVMVKKYIGFLPEESYLYGYLTPLETLDYYGRLFGISRSERRRRSEELLEMVGLAGVGHRPVGEFSKGMMRRIGLAQALVNDPDLLILDEPTSGLDPIGTRQVKQLLQDLRGRGKTILLSSHLLGDVQDVCDRMVMLYGGKIRAEGTVEDLLDDSQHTILRMPRLSAEVIEKIERVLQQSGAAIESVEAPRQRLEDLFMQIVDEARREHAETSGATEGGPTAEFLLGAEQGKDLVEALQRAVEAPSRGAVRQDDAKPLDSQGPAEEMLESLAKGATKSQGPAKAARKKQQTTKPDVDSAVIKDLLDQRDQDGGE